jgi:hypothetical protein
LRATFVEEPDFRDSRAALQSGCTVSPNGLVTFPEGWMELPDGWPVHADPKEPQWGDIGRVK